MQEKEKEILFRSGMLFRKFGFKQVTMDQISTDMGMSKKTLYKYFNNKKDLISKLIAMYIEREKLGFNYLLDDAHDAIDEMIRMIHHVMQMFDLLDVNTFDELKKYYPKEWNILDDFLKRHIRIRIQTNINRGLEEGLYREDLDVDIISRLYVVKVLGIMEENTFPLEQYNKKKLIRVLAEYHMLGIVNEKGRTVFKSYLKEGISSMLQNT